MNNIIKTTCRILLVLGLSLFFICCEKDFYEEGLREQRSGILRERISYNELQQNSDLIDKLEEVRAKLSSTGSINNRLIGFGDFFIETDDVLLLRYGGLKSYTFPIYFQDENERLKNLVIAEKTDGTYVANLLEYNLTPQEKIDLANGQLKTLTNPVVTTRLNSSGYQVANSGCIYITITVIVACSTGLHDHNNMDQWGGCTAQTPPRIKTITEVLCGSTGGSDSGPPPGYGDGGNSGSGGVAHDYPTSETNPDEYENGISEPVLPNLSNPNPQNKTPCTELTKVSTNTQEKAALVYLKGKTGEASEYGFNITKNNITGNHNPPIAGYASIYNSSQIKPEVGGNYIGYMHTHDLDEHNETVPMFSPGDIDYLFRVAREHDNNGQPKNYAEYFIMLIVPEGTFALKIKDVAKFYNFRSNGKWKSSQELDELTNKYRNRKPTDNIKGFQIDLLNLIKEMDAGFGLYEADEGFNTWRELALNPDNPDDLISQPCN